MKAKIALLIAAVIAGFFLGQAFAFSRYTLIVDKTGIFRLDQIRGRVWVHRRYAGWEELTKQPLSVPEENFAESIGAVAVPTWENTTPLQPQKGSD